ncbi:Ser/Thr protein kinase RdoA involved in Cpx stress response, MazF antagonist [Kushneria avicenniae]|uniref:Stress response kinase A n=1 Tax=Kushneria avicenniae TaxID=402385 RepID=A0A1I1G1A2_9GAMM|nr:Ser/Thr protein kinase RdoA involved in Cpx stress response, MazF antagonist [Kushneria avicenniae]
MVSHPFEQLDPARVVAAMEAQGFRIEGEPFALNSYENRVFLWRDDQNQRFIVKFYRPDRLSDAAILEEHAFVEELHSARCPVNRLWRNDSGETLHYHDGFRLAIFHFVPGQAPELDNPEHLFSLGSMIGRMHAVARRRPFSHRSILRPHTIALESIESVHASHWLNARQQRAHEQVSQALLDMLPDKAWPDDAFQRVHGDCHLGNILGREDHFTLVDFDDCVMAPAIQDLWMLLTGEDEPSWQAQLAELIEGYEEHCELDRQQFGWIEQLRTLRLVRYSAWLVERWSDPAFPRAFPWLASEHYWDQHIRTLEQQRVALSSPRWLA